MHDVARVAQVSLKTVSRVVNGEPGVRPETAQRVLAAIDELGFRRNDLARGLRRGSGSATIGLIIGDLANPFYSRIARAVERRAHEEGTLLITGSSDEDPRQERELAGNLLTRRVNGLLVVPAGGDHGWLSREMSRGVHVVYLDRPANGNAADTVLFDNVGGARAAVEHLIASGHRRIAIVGDSPILFTVQERFAGYRAALRAAGLPLDPRLVRLGPQRPAGAERVMAELLAMDEPPDAVFTTNNRMTVGVLHGLWAAGCALGLVGFDDFELADLLGITVMAGDAAAMGRHGADLLFSRLGGDGGSPKRIALPPALIDRGSGVRIPSMPR